MNPASCLNMQPPILHSIVLKNNLTLGFEDKIIFIADHIINALNEDKTLLTFISKNFKLGNFQGSPDK